MNQINLPCRNCEKDLHGSCIASDMYKVLDDPKKHCSCLANDHKRDRFPTRD